jgi:hypothetical protein
MSRTDPSQSNIVKFPPRHATTFRRGGLIASSLFQDAVDRAAAEIFRRWSRFLPAAEAREQAEQFRRCADMLAREGRLTDAELDAVVAIVATEMGADQSPQGAS